MFFDGCNIRRDVGLRGEEILHGASDLHLRRAAIINHRDLIEKRELARQEIRSAKLTKMSENNEEHRLKNDANNEAVCRVLEAAQDDGRRSPDMELYDEANLEVTVLEDFAVLTVPLLKAFILAHDDKVKLKIFQGRAI